MRKSILSLAALASLALPGVAGAHGRTLSLRAARHAISHAEDPQAIVEACSRLSAVSIECVVSEPVTLQPEGQRAILHQHAIARLLRSGRVRVTSSLTEPG